jgi:hypothetical protein
MFWHWLLLYLFVSIAIGGIYTILLRVHGYIRNTYWAIWSTFFCCVIAWEIWLIVDLVFGSLDLFFGTEDDSTD